MSKRLLRPIAGPFVGPQSYQRLRRAFQPESISIADCTIDRMKGGAIDRAATCLDRCGIVVLPDLVEPATVDAARAEADRLADLVNRAIASAENFGECDGVLWQVGYSRVRDHDALGSLGKPIANLRSRQRGSMNGGLIDVFSVELAAAERGWGALLDCCAALRAAPVSDIIAAVSKKRCAQINLLRNDSVTVTRGLHVDNLQYRYKAFLYLSDVFELGDGPYAYVPASHRRLDLLRREARLNALSGRFETDSIAFEGLDQPVLAAKGTVIVSCQTGVHRGLPQQIGRSRTVLVGDYRL